MALRWRLENVCEPHRPWLSWPAPNSERYTVGLLPSPERRPTPIAPAGRPEGTMTAPFESGCRHALMMVEGRTPVSLGQLVPSVWGLKDDGIQQSTRWPQEYHLENGGSRGTKTFVPAVLGKTGPFDLSHLLAMKGR